MEDLKFPVSKKSLPNPEPLGMDEYAKLVLQNCIYLKELHPDFQQRKQEFVNVPFRLGSEKK